MSQKRSSNRRRRAEAFICKLLTTVCWTLLSPAEQRLALESAHDFGREFADEWDDAPDRAAYVDTAIWWCFSERHCDTVELGLWEQSTGGLSIDPRLASFAAGCYERRSELGK